LHHWIFPVFSLQQSQLSSEKTSFDTFKRRAFFANFLRAATSSRNLVGVDGRTSGFLPIALKSRNTVERDQFPPVSRFNTARIALAEACVGHVRCSFVDFRDAISLTAPRRSTILLQGKRCRRGGWMHNARRTVLRAILKCREHSEMFPFASNRSRIRPIVI
jgi:hypothetical protein